MTTEYTIAMTLNATPDGTAKSSVRTEVELVCGYALGRPGSFYRHNGDPGDPPEPDEAWVLAVWSKGTKLADDHPLTKLVLSWMDTDDSFYKTVCEMLSAKQAIEAETMYASWVETSLKRVR